MSDSPAVVTIIQARVGSSRLPNKIMLPLLGQPALVRMVKRVQQAKLAGTIVVATTTDPVDDPIVELCQAEDFHYFRGHPTDLLDRHYQVARQFEAEVVVKIPSDVVLIDPAIIDRVLAEFLTNADKYDYVSNLHPPTYPDGNDVEVMSMTALEIAWQEAYHDFEREHTTPFFWENPDRFRLGNVTWETGFNYAMTHRWVLDYEADYQLIEAIFVDLSPQKPYFSLFDILALLERRPELADLNADYVGVNWYRHHLDQLKTISTAATRFTPSLTTPEIEQLSAMALKVREHVIRLATDGGCFIGASLSCVDLVVYLYTHFLDIDQTNLTDPERDYLFLSKGHDVPALYGTFVELGWLEPERLGHHLKTTDDIYWHPNRNIPGVEFHSGSLGHLLSVAVGVALDCKLRGQTNKVVVITGDGELNEGSNWEACLVAAAYQLDNLVIIVDRNQFQANLPTESLIPLEPLAQKFEAFGCQTKHVDGHDFAAMAETFTAIPLAANQPSVIIAETVRGRGLPSIERRADRWFCNFTAQEIEQLLAELHGIHQAKLTSDVLVVR